MDNSGHTSPIQSHWYWLQSDITRDASLKEALSVQREMRSIGGRYSAARVAGCTAMRPNPLRRLHIAASSA
jgi:hypothetical protein